MEFEERYFREELDYLRQLSKLLATEKPHLARFRPKKMRIRILNACWKGWLFLPAISARKLRMNSQN
ncbi:hypothetical protein EB564_0010230 [Escherichia coli]|nr:hypothetical protein [Escherichia coli]